MKKTILICGILLALTFGAKATTWFPVEHTCPICNHKDKYQEIGSYGGYIYGWPSKNQYVFWPLTDSPSIYCCKKCCFSTYMWDFDSVPENKIKPISEYLSTITLSKKHKDYMDIPMSKRLEIAEGVYRILGRGKEFWCKFHRVIGYHYDEEKQGNKAKESRVIALNIAKEMLTDTLYKGQEKEIYVIMAAMYNFTANKDSSLICLDEASSLTYQNPKWKEANVSGLDEYLTGWIIQYKEAIRKEDD